MKIAKRKMGWLTGALLLWLAAAPLAQAFYNPNTGRWLSRDPIEERGGKNLYRFAHNRPTWKVDVLGLIVATFGPVIDREHPFAFGAEHGFTQPNSTLDFTCVLGASGYRLEFIWVVDVFVSIMERNAVSWLLDDFGF